MDIRSLAERLGAEAVLQGNVRRYQDKISVTARLFNGSNGVELWSETYDRELSDIYAIQEDIARHVGRALHVVLPVAAERRLKNLGTRNVEAYDSYLRAIDFLRQPAEEMTLLMAEALLRESLALDPGFAKAHAAMCTKHLKGYELSRDASRFGPAEAACQRALEIDDESAEVRVVLGYLYIASGKYENALHELHASLEDNENLADAYIGLGRTYEALNRLDEAEANYRLAIDTDVSYWGSFNAMGNFLFAQSRFVEAAEFYQMYINRSDNDGPALSNLGAAYYLAGEFRKAASAWEQAIKVRPTRSVYSNTGTMYFYLGDFEKAADRYAMAANMAPNDYVVWGNLADAYQHSEKFAGVADVTYKRALQLTEATLEVNPNDAEAMSFVAYFQARLGNSRVALEMDAAARDKAPNTMYVYYNSALVHAILGNAERAIEAMERAVDLDYQPELLRLDPAFAELQDEERFRQLVK
jgi:tetratricopeptide (TPR) repeat protein